MEKQHIFALLFFLQKQVHLFNWGRWEELYKLYLAKSKSILFHPRKLTETDMTSGKSIAVDIWVCPMPKCYHEKSVQQECYLNPLERLSLN